MANVKETGELVAKKSNPSATLNEALLRLMSLTSDLERAWSDSLDDKQTQKALEAFKEAWGTFFGIYIAHHGRVAESYPQLGADVVGESIPLSDDVLLRLDILPADLQEQYRQCSLAGLYLFESLTRAFEGVNRPTGMILSLATGQPLRTWWEAGAFNLIRARAAALGMLLQQQVECLAKIIQQNPGLPYYPSPIVPTPPQWFQQWQLSESLVEYGFCVEALPSLLLTTRLYVAEQIGEIEPPDASQLICLFQEIPDLSTLGELCGKLSRASERIGRGEQIDGSYAVLLAHEFPRRLSKLVLNPPSQSVWQMARERTNGKS